MNPSNPMLFIILGNLFPVFGVLFLSWDINAIIFYYLFEGLAITFYTFFKLPFAHIEESVLKDITTPYQVQNTHLDDPAPNNNQSVGLDVKIGLMGGYLAFFGTGVLMSTGMVLTILFNAPNFSMPNGTTLLTALLITFASYGVDFFLTLANRKDGINSMSVKQLQWESGRILLSLYILVVIAGLTQHIFESTSVILLIGFVVLTTLVEVFPYYMRGRNQN